MKFRVLAILAGVLLAATVSAQTLTDVINEFNTGVAKLNAQEYVVALEHFNQVLSMAEVVGDSANDMKAQAEKKEEGQQRSKKPAPDEDGMAYLLEQLRSAATVLDAKATPDEAKGYKQWVVSVAVTVANAAKEGGFLGIGGELISDKEKAALESVSSALGL